MDGSRKYDIENVFYKIRFDDTCHEMSIFYKTFGRLELFWLKSKHAIFHIKDWKVFFYFVMKKIEWKKALEVATNVALGGLKPQLPEGSPRFLKELLQSCCQFAPE